MQYVTLPGFMLSNLSKSNPVVLLSPISSSHQTCVTIVINVLTTYLNNNLMVYNSDLRSCIETCTKYVYLIVSKLS